MHALTHTHTHWTTTGSPISFVAWFFSKSPRYLHRPLQQVVRQGRRGNSPPPFVYRRTHLRLYPTPPHPTQKCHVSFWVVLKKTTKQKKWKKTNTKTSLMHTSPLACALDANMMHTRPLACALDANKKKTCAQSILRVVGHPVPRLKACTNFFLHVDE